MSVLFVYFLFLLCASYVYPMCALCDTEHWKLDGSHMENPSEGSQTNEEKRSNTQHCYHTNLLRATLG